MIKKIFLSLLISTFLLSFLGCERDGEHEEPKTILRVNVSDGIAPLLIEFDASGSYAREGHIVSYTFTFGDGRPDLVTTNPITTITYEKPGQFWASVTVKDSEGEESTDFQVIRVTDPGEGDIEIGEPSFGGTGCSGSTATAVLTPDQKGISILFDQMTVEAGQGGPTTSRHHCNIAIPIKVPSGESVSVFKIDYRGFVSNPVGGKARLNVEYFFAGMPGPIMTKTFTEEMDREYLLTSDIASSTNIWSDCGAEVLLRINTEISATTNQNEDPVLASLDTLDAVSGITYHIQKRKCSLP